MKISRFRFLGLAVLLTGCVSSVRSASESDPVKAALDRRALAARVVDNWHDTSALAARRLMQEYGPPDEVYNGHLAWNDNKPWKRTVVRDEAPLYVEGDEIRAVEQTVDFPMTPAQIAAVTAFDGRLSYDARNAQLSSKSESEELNYARLNLADDIASRRMSPTEARFEFEKILSLEQSGKSSPYLLGLRFTPGLP